MTGLTGTPEVIVYLQTHAAVLAVAAWLEAQAVASAAQQLKMLVQEITTVTLQTYPNAFTAPLAQEGRILDAALVRVTSAKLTVAEVHNAMTNKLTLTRARTT